MKKTKEKQTPSLKDYKKKDKKPLTDEDYLKLYTETNDAS
jgi:hypothetical protein